MPPPQAPKQVRPARRGQHAKAHMKRLAVRAALAATRARAAAPPPAAQPARRGFRARPQQQRAGAARGGDESDPEEDRILEPAGDGGSEAEHPGSDDEMAGGVAAILEQPGGLFAQLPGYRVRVRLSLGGLPWQQGSWGRLHWVTLPLPVPHPLRVSTATPSPIKRVCAAATWACAPSAPSAMPWCGPGRGRRVAGVGKKCWGRVSTPPCVPSTRPCS
jgi:hypothetical protein